MKSRLLFGVVVALAILPTFAFAAHIDLNTNVWTPNILKGPLSVCTGNYLNPGASSGRYASAPCQNLCDFVAQIIQVLYFIIGVGIWVLIPVMFLYSGITIMLARGNPAKVSDARKALTGTVVGVVIMLSAWIIVSTFVGFFKLTGIGGFNQGGNCLVSQPTGGNNGSSCSPSDCGSCPNGESCLWNGSSCGCSGGD